MLANLIDQPIVSIYPIFPVHVGEYARPAAIEMRAAYNRIIYPAEPGSKPPLFAIMWCCCESYDDNRSPNHFVPVLP